MLQGSATGREDRLCTWNTNHLQLSLLRFITSSCAFLALALALFLLLLLLFLLLFLSASFQLVTRLTCRTRLVCMCNTGWVRLLTLASSSSSSSSSNLVLYLLTSRRLLSSLDFGRWKCFCIQVRSTCNSLHEPRSASPCVSWRWLISGSK